MRDLAKLIGAAGRHGGSVEVYARRLLDDPLPWTRMRKVYRLIGLAKRHGSEPVELACSKALECEVIDVGLIERIIAAAGETNDLPSQGVLVAGRFARQHDEFKGATR